MSAIGFHSAESLNLLVNKHRHSVVLGHCQKVVGYSIDVLIQGQFLSSYSTVELRALSKDDSITSF